MLRIAEIVITSKSNYDGLTQSDVGVIVPGRLRCSFHSPVRKEERQSCIFSLKDCDTGKW